ncbi:plasmid stabilization protein [Jiella sp. MQZ9-1]|uniref:Plasmid stabilization protein n=1 Tax=Jiella flava TaxID=2816857 RepID=A0A939JRD7_9HYPH|nr:plasmid stabilization protein [Jiella flava]MBO0661803.1 plasmid stabilization protein [Jiella flava]MCD2470444.1 plasmid stabilization protein [Jiella flava]
MTSLTIHDLDEELTRHIRERAAQHGRSVEAEAAVMLREASGEPHIPPPESAEESGKKINGGTENLVDAIRKHFEHLGGVALDIPPREPMRNPPRFK